MTMGWLSKPLSSICLIWAFCLHLSWVPGLKAGALPLFASLLGSEENDNNEAWRLSTASHTNIHTYNTRNTDNPPKCRHTQSHSLCTLAGTHACIFTHTCNVRLKQVAISFCLCHTKCANVYQLFIFVIYCKLFI